MHVRRANSIQHHKNLLRCIRTGTKRKCAFQFQQDDKLLHFIGYITQLKLTPLQVGLSGNILQHLKPGGINEPEFLHSIERFANWLRQQEHVMHVRSITDTYKRLNKNMHGDDSD